MRYAEFQEAEVDFKVAYPNPPGAYSIGPYRGSSTLYIYIYIYISLSLSLYIYIYIVGTWGV